MKKKNVIIILVIIIVSTFCILMARTFRIGYNEERICKRILSAMEKKDSKAICDLFSKEATAKMDIESEIQKMFQMYSGRCQRTKHNSTTTKEVYGREDFYSRTRSFYYVTYNDIEYIVFIMQYKINMFEREKEGVNCIAMIPKDEEDRYPNYQDNQVPVFIP